MVSFEEIKYSIKNLWHRKLRSSLTILSILIGIMSIAALTSFGLGIKNYINNLSETTGVNTIFIEAKGFGAPGTNAAFSISKDEVDFVSKIIGVQELLAYYEKPVDIKSKQQTKYNYLVGFDASQSTFLLNSMGTKIFEGRMLKPREIGKVVLGYTYKKDNGVFKNKLNVGDKIIVANQTMQIVGFLSEIGSPTDDAGIYITQEYYEQIYPNNKNQFSMVMLKADSDVNPSDLSNQITEKLRKHLDEKKGKETFYVMTIQDAIKTFSSILDIITAVLVLIALISVIVASVNIMNTMYTAVLERTKEIGIMKAVGAQNNDIFFIFMLESGTLGLFGGTVGMLLGYGIAYIGGVIAAAAGYPLLQPFFPWYLTVSCLVFSAAIGAGSGFFPALAAARQKPVDSLRYE